MLVVHRKKDKQWHRVSNSFTYWYH